MNWIVAVLGVVTALDARARTSSRTSGASTTTRVPGREPTPFVRFPDDEGEPTVVLAGEGAYEGLTAVMAILASECPNIRGCIIDGIVPEAEGTFPAS